MRGARPLARGRVRRAGSRSQAVGRMGQIKPVFYKVLYEGLLEKDCKKDLLSVPSVPAPKPPPLGPKRPATRCPRSSPSVSSGRHSGRRRCRQINRRGNRCGQINRHGGEYGRHPRCRIAGHCFWRSDWALAELAGLVVTSLQPILRRLATTRPSASTGRAASVVR
jgi:hypothetical protein